ncbi:MAG: periplasmic heavy metal sensor [Deltaproteobacteria bacterium]|nr:periplasmic heavy metal sensor [Deltaproteobacteria bacterium]
MGIKSFFRNFLIFLILAGLLPIPALGQEKGGYWDEMHKMHRAMLVKELKLSPEKAKDFNGLEERFSKERNELVERLRKSEAELQNALAAAPTDETRIKGLVAAILADQGRMVNSFESQRDKEMAMLTPVQQGQYLLFFQKCREEMMEEHMKLRQK